jgi:hypothetical protein
MRSLSHSDNNNKDGRQCTDRHGQDRDLCISTTRKAARRGLTTTPTSAGYYRVRYDGDMLSSILKDEKALALPERVGLVGDIAALTNGYMPLGEAMALAPKLSAHAKVPPLHFRSFPGARRAVGMEREARRRR